MSNNTLSHPTRRFLMDRLERLHESLENLGQRLREGIASLVGNHIGDAIKDALAILLLRESPTRAPEPYPRRESAYSPRDFHRDGYDEYDRDFWRHEPDLPDREPGREPEPETEPKPSRWKTLLTGLVHLSTWWLQRRSWRSFLVAGAVVGAAALVASPLVGGVVAVVGTAVLLTRVADRAAHAADRATKIVTP